MNTNTIETPMIFGIGDVVKHKKSGEEHIVCYVEFNTQGVAYKTDRGAWFQKTDFDFVRKADIASLRKLYASLCDNDEIDDEGVDTLTDPEFLAFMNGGDWSDEEDDFDPETDI